MSKEELKEACPKNIGETKDLPSFSYYSNILNKPFDTIKELREAEEVELRKQEAEKAAQMEKKTDAKKVEDAYKHFLETQVAAAQEVEEAKKAYIEARSSFISKYGSYHATYSNDNGKETVTVSDIVDAFFDGLRALDSLR